MKRASLNTGSPLVSVIIPVYNRSHLVTKAIGTVLNQTFKDLEIIVVDDGSTDDTGLVLKECSAKILASLCILTQSNKGPAAARNTGWKAASGKYIAFLDSDDHWSPEKIKLQLEILNNYSGSSLACFTNCRFFGNPEIIPTSFEQANFNPKPKIGLINDSVKYVLKPKHGIYIQSVLILKELLEDINGFDESLYVAEDTDFIFNVALRTKFSYVSDVLVSVDRTPKRSVGLIEHYHNKTDISFQCRARMYNKWLQMFPIMEKPNRQIIKSRLRHVYWDWMKSKITSKDILGMLAVFKAITGDYEH